MNCRRIISSIIGVVYMLTTQLVVHAFAMHDMTAMHGMDHGTTSQDCIHDRDTHHMQSDLSIGESTPAHDSSSCITLAKTASKSTIVSQITPHKTLLVPTIVLSYSTTQLSVSDSVTTADIQPPGWSSFLDTHYGHGIVMIS